MPTAMPAPRRPRRRVDGVLLLDKPAGISSNAALQRAKRIYAAEKAGHTGTLDPLATGLLPLCFGEATKFAQALLESRKEYRATVRFGIATSTGDAEGEVIARAERAVSRAAFEAVLPSFIGRVMQRPPAHAALKFEGRSYYEYARRGIEIPRAPRAIEIYAIDVVDWSPPEAVLHVACGKGTYIRVLAEDLAAAAGGCAHLAALRRVATGPFALDGAVTLERLEAMDTAARDALLLPADAPLAAVARLDVDAPTAQALVDGRIGSVPREAPGRYRCYGPGGRFLGLVECSGGVLRALRLSRTDTPAALRVGSGGLTLES
jgi:tRNA pseudouridine55 synthase